MVLVSLIYVLELFSFDSKAFHTTFWHYKSQILISICLNPIILDITENNSVIFGFLRTSNGDSDVGDIVMLVTL